MKNILTILSFLFVIELSAQINPNTLFLVVSKNNPKYRNSLDFGTFTAKAYTIDNAANNWNASFIYHKNDMYDFSSQYVLLLPQSMFHYFKTQNNVLFVKTEEPKWLKMDLNRFSYYFSDERFHYTEIYYNKIDKKYVTQHKYNLFIIEEEDLEKDYIPCYEVSMKINLNH